VNPVRRKRTDRGIQRKRSVKEERIEVFPALTRSFPFVASPDHNRSREGNESISLLFIFVSKTFESSTLDLD
jgi:hypothetical protein